MTKLYAVLTSILLFLHSTPAFGYYIVSEAAKVNLNTQKVSYIQGFITPEMEDEYVAQLMKTVALSGDRIIVINSGGGYVSVGQHIIESIEREKAQGVRQICIVTGQASSMAFNILTHCDIRLASPNATMLVHKIAVGSLDPMSRATARNLRIIADQIDKDDEPYRQANAKAMHLTLKQYDEWTEAEYRWTAEQLLGRHYLDSLVKITQ